MSEKNILLTTMSTLPNEPKENTYCAEIDGQVKYCKGIGQLEAGTKYFLSKVRIDKIVVIGTKATEDGSHVYDDNASAGIRKCDETTSKNAERISADKFYVEQILKFVKEAQGEAHPNDFMKPIESNRDLKEDHFLVLKDVAPPTDKIEGIKEVDNVQGIVNAILEYAKDDDIHLYIDMQGGGRTSGYVRNAVLSILGNERESKVTLEEIIATEYGANNKENRIVNETKRYKIMDLAAAMNSFVRYGKVDLLKSYCEDRGVKAGDETALGKLLRCMESVDDSISLCNVKELENAISDMKQLLNNDTFNTYNKEDSADQVFVKSVFDILRDGIKRDYGALLDEENADKQTVELIAWCTRKGFLQQALTLVEDKMPKVFLKKEQDVINDKYILKYKIKTKPNEDDENADKRLRDFAAQIGHGYNDVENNILYAFPYYDNYDKWEDTIQYKLLENTGRRNSNGVGLANVVIDTSIVSEDNNKWKRNQKTENSLKSIFSVQELSTIGNDGIFMDIIDNDELVERQKELVYESQKEIIAREFSSSDFMKKYCEYRIYNQKKVDLGKPESLYYFLKRVFAQDEEDDEKIVTKKEVWNKVEVTEAPYFTIVNSVRMNNQWVKYRKPATSWWLGLWMKFNTNLKKANESDSVALRRLDDLLCFHNALKAERNCANHAAEEGIRLPASVVKRALEIYVEEAREFVK